VSDDKEHGRVSEFAKVCEVADLPAQGSVRRVDLAGEPIAIVATEGEYHALDDICSHDEVSLADGEVEGHTVECWLHGSRFDVRTGEALCLPAKKPVDVYDIRILDDGVYLSTAPRSIATELESHAR
jgi:3-phenylpropionate/trans-cinnamate dioxygenase ferredoxin subunit